MVSNMMTIVKMLNVITRAVDAAGISVADNICSCSIEKFKRYSLLTLKIMPVTCKCHHNLKELVLFYKGIYDDSLQ